MNERRHKLVVISPVLLHDLLTDGNVITAVCTEGLPPDAQFRGMAHDFQRDVYELCFESDTWEPVPFGARPPEICPRYATMPLAPFLEQAEKLIEHYADGSEYGRTWLEEYRAFKKQTGWPENGD